MSVGEKGLPFGVGLLASGGTRAAYGAVALRLGYSGPFGSSWDRDVISRCDQSVRDLLILKGSGSPDRHLDGSWHFRLVPQGCLESV